jgi:predicted O-methyltransferase YrrM
MDKVIPISLVDFKERFNVPDIDLVELGLFGEEDFKLLEEAFGYLKGKRRFLHFIKDFHVMVRNPKQILLNLDQVVFNQIKDLKKFSGDQKRALKDRYPISDYILKASIAASFKPKTILEIGTFYGWGAASFKVAVPEATVYTINPKETVAANNPIMEGKVGEAFRKKGLLVHQIWADSTRFDFSTLPPIDVAYIDGNHNYEFVYQDLENTAKVVTKAVILDDYLPSKNSPRGEVRAWGPWNKSVTSAVDDFLRHHQNVFSQTYWIEETPIGVLVK